MPILCELDQRGLGWDVKLSGEARDTILGVGGGLEQQDGELYPGGAMAAGEILTAAAKGGGSCVNSTKLTMLDACRGDVVEGWPSS